MSVTMTSKLNWLIQHTAPGNVIVQSWLTKHAVSPQLAQKYVKSGWLTKLRSGVYVRSGKPPSWHNALDCLEKQLNVPVHIAGLTSLTYQGRSHYLQVHEKNIWLETPPKTPLPRWFKAFPENSFHTSMETQDSAPHWLFVTSNKLLQDDPSDLTEIEINGTRLKASRVELAAFELLNSVPRKISFEHAAEVFQGLTSLSPRKVQSILNRSQTIKTNRLFLFLANHYQHPWISRIDEADIKLGAGKRQIVAGGTFDHRYQITVPDSFSTKEFKP